MPAAKPLNDRQFEVLRWIAAGCPARDWPDESHKHSARALQSRGLAHVARRRGVWIAEITEAGRDYVETGGYPARLNQPPKAVRPTRRAAPRSGRADSVRISEETTPRPPVELGPPAPADAKRLFLRLLAAGGRLEVDTHQTRRPVDELKAASYLPPGMLLKTRGRGWHHQLIYLRDDPRAVVSEREVPVPSRLAKPHPLAKAYREDRDRHEVSAGELARATRIVHALATTFEELGYEFRVGGRTPDGQFVVVSEGGKVPVRISEKSAPGGGPVPHYNLRRGRPLPDWQARRQKEFIPTGQLTILVGGQYGGGDGRQCRFSDTKTRRLEDLVPAVVREVEMRFFERRQDQAEAEREDREQEQRWQAVLADAEHRASEAFRADVLSQRATAWRVWHEQARYVDELAGHVADLPEAEEVASAEWLSWARQRLKATDPTLVSHDMPVAPAPTKDFLQPHIRGWAGAYREFNA